MCDDHPTPEEQAKGERMVLTIIGIVLTCMFVLAWNWHAFLVWLCYWC